MGGIVPSSIRSKLILLGILASLPIVFLMVYNSWDRKQAVVASATGRIGNILDFAVLHEEETVRATHRLMATLAVAPQLRQDPARCGEFLARALKENPEFLNFGMARADGEVVCSAVPRKAPLYLNDLPHFQGALWGRSFTRGRYVVGRIVEKPIVPFAYPLFDPGGKVSKVLFASMDLAAVTNFEREIDAQTPEDSVYLRADGDGVVMSAYPVTPMFRVGEPIPPSLAGKIAKAERGPFRDVGSDGVDRLYMFSRYYGEIDGQEGYSILGIPTRPLFAEADRLLAVNLAVLFGLGVVYFAVIWYGGNALIFRPVSVMMDASKRLAAGDPSARTGLESTPGELGRLGAAFDEMAAALQAAAAATENERARSEAIIAAIGDGINIIDRDFRILYQNQVHIDRIGRHTGEYCYRAYHGRDGVCDDCVAVRAFETGRIHAGEVLEVRRGKTSFLEVTASPLKDATGQIVAGIEVVRDITERKENEHRISRSLRMLAALHRVDLNIIRGSGLEETLGVICDAVVRMGSPLCWVGLAMRDYTARVAVARGKGKEITKELDVRWDESVKGMGAFGEAVRTGRTVVSGNIQRDPRFAPWRELYVRFGLLSLACVPLKSDDGTAVGALMAYHDREDGFSPTEIADLETFAQQCAVAVLGSKWMEGLREANRRLTLHVNRMPLGYILWDAGFRVTEWNPAAERIFGWTADEAIGRGGDFLVPEEERADVKETWDRLMGGEETRATNGNLRKDGRKIECEWFNTPIQDASGSVTGVLSMVNDVTEKTFLERQVQTAQRMEAVGTLAGGVAHDFNNALTGIFGFGEMLRPFLRGDERATTYLNEVMRSAERASTLTRQLLTYSRRQPISPVNLDLNDVAKDLLKLVSKVVGERIEIRTELAQELPAVHADPGQIEQVLMNLVINARDAMPDGGKLVIGTSTAELDEEYVRYHPETSTGSFVVLTVSDTGVGMDARTQKRIFDPFFTTKGPSKGTGLGLAMVYGIVRQHNGFIHLYSEPGQGTTFKIYIPPVQGAVDRQRPAGPVELRGGAETVLLAEDDEQVRALVEDTLRNLGYTVLSARNGQEAVALYERNRENVALALLDMAMPVMGGKEAYEAIYGISPGVKALFMSGYAADGAHETFLLISGAPFLPKPFGPAELGRKVREVLDAN